MIAVGIVILGLFSCISALYIPTEKDALTQNTSLEKLQEGRALYTNKCASCHNLHLPAGYTTSEWEHIITKMQKRAKIDDKQKELISQYLQTDAKKDPKLKGM